MTILQLTVMLNIEAFKFIHVKVDVFLINIYALS